MRIDSTLDPQVKYDIFERLNSGSVRLESHELRNAILRGPFNTMCKDLSKDANFRILLQIPEEKSNDNSKVRKMEDVELVLRFFSLMNSNYKSYKKTKEKQFKDFLSGSLEEKNNLPKEKIDDFAKLFRKVMAIIVEYFGPMAFAKFKFEKSKFIKQSNFNAAVYDALTISVASEVNLDKLQITAKQISDFKGLFKNSSFHDCVSGSILDSMKLVNRIDMAREVFKV